MAIAESYTSFDGHTYKPGEEIPSLGSFTATRVNGKIRHYQGLSKDFYLLKAASKTEKYNDLETGSTALLLDTSEKYRFETADNEWYKVASASGGGGGEGGVTSYPELTNLPQINDVELIGNKSLAELGIQPSGDYIGQSDMESYAQPKGNYVTGEELEEKGYLTEIPDNYVTDEKLDKKGYLTKIPDNYVTDEKLAEKLDEDGYITNEKLEEYAQPKGDYLTQEEFDEYTKPETEDIDFSGFFS